MQIGSLVECLFDFRAAYGAQYPRLAFPTKGGLYVVRDIVEERNMTGLLLQEIVNEECLIVPTNKIAEPAFDANDFRELQPPGEICIADLMEHSLHLPA